MARQFASQGDLTEKKVTFTELAPGAWAYTAEGDPTSGVIIGDDAVMVIDTRATPVAAQDLIQRIRAVTDKPIRYVVLTHYHAVRVMGASAYGAEHVIASANTRDWIDERGAADFKSEVGRFPRLFQAVETVPGLTWPTLTFTDQMTLWLGKLEVHIMHVGRGHSHGDTIVWLPKDRVLFSGDLVESGVTPYTGDAFLVEWPKTLDKLRALKPLRLVPGRGPALTTPAQCANAIAKTQEFLTDLRANVAKGVRKKWTLKQVYEATRTAMDPKYGHWPIYDHCMPFDVSRCYDEVRGIKMPRVWTAKRDREMWRELEG